MGLILGAQLSGFMVLIYQPVCFLVGESCSAWPSFVNLPASKDGLSCDSRPLQIENQLAFLFTHLVDLKGRERADGVAAVCSWYL